MEIELNKAYWCKTEELAKEFLKEAQTHNDVWLDKDFITPKAMYDMYKEEACYSLGELSCFNRIFGCDKAFYEKLGYEIIEYKSEYPTIKKHIVNNNKIIVKLSNGKVGISKCHPEDKFDIEIGTKLAIERAYEIWKEESNAENKEEYKKTIKEYIKIIKDYSAYPFYSKFAYRNFPKYSKYFIIGNLPKMNKIYKYIGEKQVDRFDSDNAVLYLIQDIDTNQVYIIRDNACEFVDKPKEKEKFVPYLYFNANGEKVGNIGEETDIVDILGNRLCIGDTIAICRDGLRKIEWVVYKYETENRINGTSSEFWENGYLRGGNGRLLRSNEKICILKSRSYNKIKNREVINGFTYILEE